MAIGSGYDIVLQFSEEYLKRKLILAYFKLPGLQKIDQTISLAGLIDATAHIKVLIPSLTLRVDRPATTNTWMRIILPFNGWLKIRSFPAAPALQKWFSISGSVFVDTPLEQDSKNLKINFSSLTVDSISVNLTTSTLSPFEASSLSSLLRFGAWSALQPMGVVTSMPFPSIALSTDAMTQNSTAPGASVCLALFMMTLAGSTAPGLPATFENLLNSNRDYAVGISPTVFNDSRDAAIKAKFANHDLPALLPSDTSVRVNKLTMELGNGQIDVSGNITKSYGSIDADIDFTAPMTLSADGTPSIGPVNVDLPGWLDALNALLPFFGSMIWEIANIAASRKIGGAFTGLKNFFTFKITGASGYLALKSKNFWVNIRPDGIIVHGEIWLTTYVGNRRSKELHVFNDDYWLSRSTGNYGIYFERYEDAIAKGYNGCWYCLRELNTG